MLMMLILVKPGWDKLYLHDDFLFRFDKFCIPSCSLRVLLIKEVHSDGLMGHFDGAKTLGILNEHFY